LTNELLLFIVRIHTSLHPNCFLIFHIINPHSIQPADPSVNTYFKTQRCSLCDPQLVSDIVSEIQYLMKYKNPEMRVI